MRAPDVRYRLILSVVLGLAAVGSHAEAQYFGQNKVRYHDFDFRILETPHFDIYHYSSEEAGARQAGVLAERWYKRLSAAFGHELRRRQPLVLYASHADFVETNVVSDALGDGIGGVTEGQRNRMALPFGLSLAETDHVIGHELVHAFQYDLARSGHPTITTMPLWFVEGMAEYYSVASPCNQTAMWMRDAVRSGRLPSVKNLDHPKYFPYRYGHALWLFIAERSGPDAVARLLEAKPGSLAGKVKQVLGLTLAQLTVEWHRSLRARYGEQPERKTAGATLTPLIGRHTGGRLNVGPALSPDGRQIAFVSEKDQFSIEIFLADATTGITRRKLLSRAANPHFDSLEFIDSAGAWDPSGRRFAFSAVRAGRPVLVVIDVANGGVEREIPFPALGQICDPSWSPDGRQIAFTGSRNGWSDLYTFDLRTGALRRWTADAFADLQPAWSPDGRSIAFSTDRFSTQLASLDAGECHLALLDVASGAIRAVPGAAAGRSIDPQWAADGGSLFFIADPDGTSNVFRIDLHTQAVTRVTSVATGVTGITPMSPALSVAGSTLAMSVYSNGEYQIVKAHAEAAAGAAAAAGPSAEEDPNSGDALPPPSLAAASPQSAGPLTSVDGSFLVKPYRRKLSLEGIGEPYVTAGGGALGSFIQAGTSAVFGDMLGDQQLGLAIQGGRRLDDFAGRAVYVNRRSRWNWGASLGYLPAVFATAAGRLTPKGDRIEQEIEYQKQFHVAATGLAQYPFNRSQRLELTAGFRRVTFGREIDSQVLSLSGRKLSDSRQTLPGAPGIGLFESSAALVYDTAVFGGTSPILGRRYRFEVAPTVGSLDFTTLVADYRQYLVPFRPVTVAVRARYLRRVGHDAGDPRLLPLVLTLRGEVRGYDLENLAFESCGGRQSLDCSVLDLITGSSLLASNLEVRFPIPGLFTRSYNYGPLPLEGFVFADGVSLRTRSFDPSGGWKGHLLRSVGAGVRLNAAGIVFEAAAARPYDRPGRGWTFAFNVGPGF